MNGENLAELANRIGEFFSAYPDRQEALDGIALHIRRFWEPRMRRKILEVLDGSSADLITPLVAEALRLHRETLRPAVDPNRTSAQGA